MAVIWRDLWRVARSAGLVRGESKQASEEWARGFLERTPPGLETHPVVLRAKSALAPEGKIGGRWVRNSDRLIATERMLAKVGRRITSVAGVSRSGMAPAAEIAMRLHVRLWSLNDSEPPIDLRGGWRFRTPQADDGAMLVVDDTVAGGTSFKKIQPTIAKLRKTREVITAAIFASPESAHLVDVFGEILPLPHFLEWNFANSIHVPLMACDFDGVLCYDCPAECDDDGDRYRQWLAEVSPLYRFGMTSIPLIVTARLEKYRSITLSWLKRHGMSCDRLVMGPWRTLTERSAASVPKFKAEVFSRSSQRLFVESDKWQAREIATLSGRSVLCPTAGFF